MADDPKDIQLRQLANVVINAYLSREARFVPKFERGTQSVMFLSRPEAAGDEQKPELNFWYERADYEPERRS